MQYGQIYNGIVKSVFMLEWSSESLELNSIENWRQDWRIEAHRRTLSSRKEIGLFCKVELAKHLCFNVLSVPAFSHKI